MLKCKQHQQAIQHPLNNYLDQLSNFQKAVYCFVVIFDKHQKVNAMKKIVFIVITLSFAITLNAKEAITGNSNTFLRDYKISQISENLYELTYENSTEKFTIEVCPKQKQCCYLLRGNNIELMYLCSELGFGLRKMPEGAQKLATGTYCNIIDNKAFSYQSLLTPKYKSEKKALALIACFFPGVISTNSTTLVFNPASENNYQKLVLSN